MHLDTVFVAFLITAMGCMFSEEYDDRTPFRDRMSDADKKSELDAMSTILLILFVIWVNIILRYKTI